MSDQIRVNGNEISWGSIIFKVNGERYFGFTSISYADKRERVKRYGMGRHQAPRARSRGKYSTDPVKVGGPKASIQALREALARGSADGKSYGNQACEIVVEFIDSGEAPQLVEIESCVCVSDASDHQEGADGLDDSLEFDCMKIYRNGLTLFDAEGT